MNKSSASAFVGKWRIVEMEQWDQDYVDMEEPGHVTFKKGGSGGFHFGCVDATLDWRYDASIDRVDFTFEGSDEGDQVNGRGWAKIEGKQLVGQIAFHLGDESGFKARKGK
jgi:hypothetical protein